MRSRELLCSSVILQVSVFTLVKHIIDRPAHARQVDQKVAVLFGELIELHDRRALNLLLLIVDRERAWERRRALLGAQTGPRERDALFVDVEIARSVQDVRVEPAVSARGDQTYDWN